MFQANRILFIGVLLSAFFALEGLTLAQTLAPPAQTKGKVYAMFVSDHESETVDSPLYTAMKQDLGRMASFFNNSGLFPVRTIHKMGKLREGSYAGVYGADATGPNIRREIRRLGETTRINPNDVFVFMSTGHGATDESNNEQFLIYGGRDNSKYVYRSAVVREIKNAGFSNFIFLTSSCSSYGKLMRTQENYFGPQGAPCACNSSAQFPDPKTVRDLFYNVKGSANISGSIAPHNATISPDGGSYYFDTFFDTISRPHAELDTNNDGLVSWEEFSIQQTGAARESYEELVVEWRRKGYSDVNIDDNRFSIYGGFATHQDNRPIRYATPPNQVGFMTVDKADGLLVTGVRPNSPASYAFGHLPTPFYVNAAYFDVPFGATCVCQGTQKAATPDVEEFRNITNFVAEKMTSPWIMYKIYLPRERKTLYQPVKLRDSAAVWGADFRPGGAHFAPAPEPMFNKSHRND